LLIDFRLISIRPNLQTKGKEVCIIIFDFFLTLCSSPKKVKRNAVFIHSIVMPRMDSGEDLASKKPKIPNKQLNEILGVVTEIFGGEHMAVKAEDGQVYMGVIRGKIKKRMWTRLGDMVIIVPWDFESKPKEGKKPKAHIVWRYTRTQQTWLENHGYVSDEFRAEINNI
jgi:translation initiation factor 1A